MLHFHCELCWLLKEHMKQQTEIFNNWALLPAKHMIKYDQYFNIVMLQAGRMNCVQWQIDGGGIRNDVL